MLRDFILARLRAELVGPDPGFPAVQTGFGPDSVKGEEFLRAQDPPRLRYGVGVLFPQQSLVDWQEEGGDYADETTEPGDSSAEVGDDGLPLGPLGQLLGGLEEPDTDGEIGRSNEFLPSAMGVSCLLRLPDNLMIEVQAARYEKDSLPGEDGRRWWRRIPIAAEIVIPGGPIRERSEAVTVRKVVPGTSGLTVYALFRPAARADRPDERLTTLTLVNGRPRGTGGPKHEDCFFQCRLQARSADKQQSFREYPLPSAPGSSDEQARLRLLYRDRRVFGIGHGCAADWSPSESGATDSVWTDSMPTYEVKPVVPRALPTVDLQMNSLATNMPQALRSADALCDAYESWIGAQDAQARELLRTDADLLPAAGANIADCRRSLKRMRSGIELLRNNTLAARAFQRMNFVMARQQIHFRLASQAVRRWTGKGAECVPPAAFQAPDYAAQSQPSWHPFQFAFILMNLRGIAEPNSEDRRLVDLLWFPTGGGKTEAYLGLTAFAIFYRRMTSPAPEGVAVLMRYTLRLLTTQQFQRAATLIAACELLRREDPEELGLAPIRIGLWVGNGVTPNTIASARETYRRMSQCRKEGTASFVLRACPWCGIALGCVGEDESPPFVGFRLPSGGLMIQCPDAGCPFSDAAGLPVLVIDEQIYRDPPALLIGTVDKFAVLPWRPEAYTIFGLGAPALSPPTLIIQDELHLISGPLGTMVGHYESAIEVLCRAKDGTSPKIVASTATIAQAADQIQALYGGRATALFPPQALNASDSFFAFEDVVATGRLYVGVFGSGYPSAITSTIRALAALLQAVPQADADASALDPYWTLVVYFNSLRELGQAASLIRADIREYLNAVWDRSGLTKALGGDEAVLRRRFINRELELTSRIAGGSTSEALEELFDNYRGHGGSTAVDVCLATNMIQVGLDVPRLSLMAIAGQPKTTAEYIQASSRIGRSWPGLVTVVYNCAKPRDRSHFERFRAYHQSLYRFVEPTSVTPFAAPVSDRALHAIAILLARALGGLPIRDRPGDGPDTSLAAQIEAEIVARVTAADPNELARVKTRLREVVERWRRIQPPTYGSFGYSGAAAPLMAPDGERLRAGWEGISFRTPTSLRSVDAACEAVQIRQYPTGESEDVA